MRLLAVDPGRTTGVALFVDGQFVQGREVKFHQLEALMDLEPDEIVIEAFRMTTKHHGVNYSDPLEAIGVMRWLALKAGIPFHLQSPSVLASRHARTAQTLHRSVHVRSAATHGLYWLASHSRQQRATLSERHPT
jgi:hypothetical protein